MSLLGLDIPAHLHHIQQYRIQRSNGSWSQRYTPGVNDIDRKTNCDHKRWTTYSNNIVRPDNCTRRVRSYFDDHAYQITSCTTSYTSTCHVPDEKPELCRGDDCPIIQLPVIPPYPEKEDKKKTPPKKDPPLRHDP